MGMAAGLILFAGWGFSQARRAEQAYTPNNLMRSTPDVIPTNTIRLHIQGNSDGDLDQGVKLVVRDALMENFGEQLAGVGDVKDAEKVLCSAIPDIEKVAEMCLKESGMTYGAKAAVKTVYFPDKTYELVNGQELFLPQGDYRALQVVLGKGEGKNWWCVMYPPLCYFDLVQRGVVPGVPAALSQLGAQIEVSREAAPEVLVIDESRAKEIPVEVRSLLLDTIRAGIVRISKALSFLAQSDEGRLLVPNMK